jgi:DNA-binding winged helix-turn-helix (wHTH) protein
LRLHDKEIVLQPRVFDLLVLLIKNRERVVPKDELLEMLWPGTVVVDSALQRAMSLARGALREAGIEDGIRTYARQGYRFCLEVQEICAETAVEQAVMAPPEDVEQTLLNQAQSAFDNKHWEQAVAYYEQADREKPLNAGDLEKWVYATRCTGDTQKAIAPLERAIAAHAMSGNQQAAAHNAILLALVQFDRRNLSVAKGWLKRAIAYLNDDDVTIEHGLWEWLSSRFAAAEGKLDDAVQHAQRAHDIGRQLGDRDIEALGLLYWGVALLATGDVQRGVDFQDEAAAAALAGEVTPLVAGIIYCGMIWCCRNRGDWGRAAEWTENFTRWCERSGMNAFPGTCRMHRAEVLTLQGLLEEAEQELAGAHMLLANTTPWAEGDAYRIKGDLCLMRGDLEEANEAYRRSHELNWDPQPGYARLLFEQGKNADAIRSLERSLQDSNWSNQQRRGMMLAQLAIICARSGDVAKAQRALRELETSPQLSSTTALQAEVATAHAETLFADNHVAEAIKWQRKSIRLWCELESSINVAHSRLRLATMLRQDDDYHGTGLEVDAAESLFQKVGAAAWVKQCQLMRSQLTEKHQTSC